jgi:CheY-like chemotaxis protein
VNKNLKSTTKYKRVLLIHNDKQNLLKLYHLFKKLFLSVDIAIDYSSAIEKFHNRKNKINLLITDLDMKDNSGYDLANRIREEATFPIIFLRKDINYLVTEIASMSDVEVVNLPLNINTLLDTIYISLKDDSIDEYTVDTLIHIYKSIIDAIKEIIKTGQKSDYNYHINSIINFFDYTKKIHENCFDLEKFKLLSSKAKNTDEQKRVFLILKDGVEKIFKKYHIFI